jgi:hypothetical protein
MHSFIVGKFAMVVNFANLRGRKKSCARLPMAVGLPFATWPHSIGMMSKWRSVDLTPILVFQARRKKHSQTSINRESVPNSRGSSAASFDSRNRERRHEIDVDLSG